jgi:O-antigen/teichoic acid export membrane protein
MAACATLVSAVVLSRILTIHDYATYRQTMLAYAFVAPLLTLGLPSALYYFLPGEERRPGGVLLENLIPLTAMGSIFSLFILLGGNRLLAHWFHNPDLSRTLLLLAPYPLLALPAGALGICLMARDRVKQIAAFNIASRLLLVLAVAAAGLAWRTPDAAVAATVLVALVISPVALRLMLASCRGGAWHPSVAGMWEQVKYAVPLGVAGMMGGVAVSLDKAIVSAMCAPGQFAIYANGAIEIPLISVVSGSVMAVILPDLVKSFKQGNCDELAGLWRRATEKCWVLLAPLMGFALAMAPELMSLLFSDRYVGSSRAFRVYALMLPIRATTFSAVLMATNHSRLVVAMTAIGLAANALLSIIFVTVMGPIGAAWATVLSNYLMAGIAVMMIARIVDVPTMRMMRWRHLLGVAVAACVPWAVVFALKSYVPPSSGVRLAVSLALAVPLVIVTYHVTRVFDLSRLSFLRKRL